MDKVFVTGGSGFIGGRLLYALAERQIPAVALSRRGGSRAGGGLTPGSLLEIRHADLLDTTSLAEAMRGCPQVIHLAAKISFDPADIAELKRVNVEGTRCVIEAARRAGVRRVIVVSSAATIGISPSPSPPLDERSPFNPRLLGHNVYLASKKEVENVVLEGVAHSDSALGLEVLVANPTTVFGPGDRSLNSGSIIRTVATGRVVPVPSGGTSVVDVDDVAEALILMLAKGKPGQRYIITHENLTFRQAFATIASVTRRGPRFVNLPLAARLPMKWAAWATHLALASMGKPAWLITPQIVEDTFLYKYFDSRRARADLGWQPRFSFAESVERAWHYYRAEGLIA